MPRLKLSGGVHMPEARDTFSGGIRLVGDPPYIKLCFCKENMTVILSVGDAVARGGLLADVSDISSDIGMPVYSGISGTVTDISEEMRGDGKTYLYITVRGDGKKLTAKKSPVNKKLSECNPDELIALARMSGIVERSGISMWQNIRRSRGHAARVLINALPCDSEDKTYSCLISEYPERLLCGIKIVLMAVGFRHADIIISESSGCKDILLRAVESCGGDQLFSVITAPDIYPLYDDGQLIRAVGGPFSKIGHIPCETGYAVFDAISCAELFEAFSDGSAVTDTLLTVSGGCVRKPQTVQVPIGTEISELEKVCDGFWERPIRIICGGRMAGSLCRIQDTIGKGTHIIQFESSIEAHAERSCIRCGKCVSVCPMSLAPLYLSKYSLEGNVRRCDNFRIDACTECGCCSYICPSHIPLAHNIRMGKIWLENLRDTERSLADGNLLKKGDSLKDEEHGEKRTQRRKKR